MANSFKNPVTLDDFTATIDIGDSMFGLSDTSFYIDYIEWQTPDNTTHGAVVTDGLGNTIFNEKCTVAHQSVFKPFYGKIKIGLKVALGAVDSGKIVIQLI